VLHSISMPTKRQRHAITETPPVEAALTELRQELGEERLDLGELVVLGAREKLARLHAERSEVQALRDQLADKIRDRTLDVDLEAIEEARRVGWVHR
jgi:hypothetical protein